MLIYTAEGVRALQMGTIAMEHGEVAESVCVFEYPEDYIYTPYISIIAGVSDEKADDNSLYEITLTMGMENARIVTTGMLKNGELAELFFDISEFSEISMCNYLKISVRCLTGKTEEMSVWLHSIKGYSAEYTSSELSNLIEQRRQQIRNEDSAEEGFDRGIIITIIGVTFAVGAVAIGLTIVFKRDEEDEDEDSDADEEAEELDE